tara:strand:- start:1080 stop:2447 length:1368 start_codon:yes stop_codon:yes gene_type:complete
MKEKIKQVLADHAGDGGLPVFGEDEWIDFTGGYKTDRQEMVKDALAEYIVENRPDYPYREISEEKAEKSFRRLLGSAEHLKIEKGDRKVEIRGEHQLKYNFDSCGLYAIQMGHSNNAVSDYFHNSNRVKCQSHDQKNPVEIWNNGDVKQVKSLIAGIFRMTREFTDLTAETYRKVCRLGAYEATQFRPSVAKFLYEAYSAKRILDTSMGWGDRLAGFWVSDAELYVGCDPNSETFECYKQQCFYYADLLGIDRQIRISGSGNEYFEFKSPKKHVIIHRVPSEDFVWGEWENTFDYMFTSPPYFSVERYAQGSLSESEQSWSRYPTFESWRDDFYLPTLQKTWESITDDGYMCINITEPKVQGKTYSICDDMVDFVGQNDDSNFLGMVGLRFMQRPIASRYWSKSEGSKVYDIEDKVKKKEYYDTVFIEPIWIFRKNNDKHELSFDNKVDLSEWMN